MPVGGTLHAAWRTRSTGRRPGVADLNFTFGSSGADRLKGDMRGVSDTSVLAARGARLLSDALTSSD